MLSFEVKNLAPDTDTIIVEVSDTNHDQMQIVIARDEVGDVSVSVYKKEEEIEQLWLGFESDSDADED